MNKECKDHLGNTYKCVKDMCDYYGILVQTFKSRLKRGMSLEDALTQTLDRKIMPCKDHKGICYEKLSDMCDAYNINMSSYYNRIRLGWSLKDTLETPCYGDKGIRCTDKKGNKYDSIKKMVESNGITASCYYDRIKRGLSPDEAISFPCMNNTIEIEGHSFSSKKNFAKKCNISVGSVNKYIREGYSYDEIYREAKRRKSKRGQLFAEKTVYSIKNMNEYTKIYTQTKGEIVKSKKIIFDHLGNEYPSFKAMCRKYNISSYMVRRRLDAGWSLLDALEKEFISKNDSCRIKRIGQTNINKQGLLMTLIRYNNFNDCDVLFEDGYLVRNTVYDYFIKGELANPKQRCATTIQAKSKYIGQRKISKYGLYMEITHYNSSKDIVVKFEDGYIRHTTAYAFSHDYVVHPAYNRAGTSINEIAIQMLLKPYGFMKKKKNNFADGFAGIELDLFNEKLGIGIEYDGHNRHKNIKKDLKKDKICFNNDILLYRIREPQLPNYNTPAKLMQINSSKQLSDDLWIAINSILEDINKEYGTSYKIINKPTLKEVYRYIEENYIKGHEGESYLANNGLKMTILSKDKNSTYTVQFEDGEKVSGLTLHNIQMGAVSHPKFATRLLKLKHEREGRSYTMNNGETFTITSYVSALDCSGIFENGIEAKHIAFDRIKRGCVHSKAYTYGTNKHTS